MKYTKKFMFRMLVETLWFAVVANILLQMTFDTVKVEHDSSVLPFIILLPLLMSAAVGTFTMLMAVHNTNVLRRYEFSLKPGREKLFYAVFAFILIAAAWVDMIYLYSKFKPFLDGALTYALKDAQIKNETPSMRREIIRQVNARYDSYLMGAKAAAAAAAALQSAVYFFSASKLVKVYRDPPDYWSGKKKKNRR